MQLKDKLDLAYLKSVKGTIFKVVLNLLKFAVITALIYISLFVISFLRLTSILPGIPQNFFSVLFTVMMLLSIAVCTFGLTKYLYFTKDNSFLLVMPAEKTALFTSKLIVYYVYELMRNITFLLPLFTAYGMVNKMPLYFYPYLAVVLIIVTAIPVVIGALLSIPAMFLSVFIKQHIWLEYIILTAVIGGAVFGLTCLISALPANLDILGTWSTTFWKIQGFMDTFNSFFAPFGVLVTFIIGKRYGVSNHFFIADQLWALLFISVFIAVILLATFFLVRPLYFKMASSPFEYRKNKTAKNYKNRQYNSFLSSVKKDLTLSYRTSEKFYSLIFTVLGLPLAIFLLNKIYSAMDTRLTGAFMTISFNILVILLFALSSNTNLAHVYSEEGGAAYLLKTSPKPYLQTLISKLAVNFVLVSLSLLTAVLIFSSFAGFDFFTGICVFAVLEFVYIGHMLWCAESDFMNPQTMQYQTTGTHVSNPNDIKAVISSFLLSALMAFLTFFFIPENVNLVWYRLIFIASLFLLLRSWLFVNKVTVYFKEKQ